MTTIVCPRCIATRDSPLVAAGYVYCPRCRWWSAIKELTERDLELRRLFEQSWAQHASAYKLLAR